jgi:putative restriction endonuclease
MKYYLAVTDFEWYNFLFSRNNEDINFWQPGGLQHFKAISPGAPFLFKLKNPYNAIAGIGFFSSHSILPIDVAWNIFEQGNGAETFLKLKVKITSLRSSGNQLTKNPNIGCIVLTDPIFFKKEDWIKQPIDWGKSTVQGKTYDTKTIIGLNLWEQIEVLLQKHRLFDRPESKKNQLLLENFEVSDFTRSYLTKVRLGQNAYRVKLTEAYHRRCSITGEKTLPALEAAHIKPFAESGPYLISNGLLLRADIHKLFDSGYVTITNDLKVEVSKKIKEEYENGHEYYKFHGQPLINLPQPLIDRPNPTFIEWHNNTIYNG